MKIYRLAIGVALWLGLCSGLAVAQSQPGYGYAAQPYYPAAANAYAGYAYNGYAYNGYAYNGYAYMAQAQRAPSASPNSAAPQAPATAAQTSPGAAYEPVQEVGTEDWNRGWADWNREWTLPQPFLLQSLGIRLGGWTDLGVSVVANRPVDRYNGVVTFNDRDGEGQLNQQWFFLERAVDTSYGGWDLGGRVDFLYGTDARFTQAADGLEASWDQTARFYQAALPQFYVDVAFNDWLIRAGHFFTILGYEVVPATGNFFYSHSYTMQYGEPFTHTGVLLTRQLGPSWKVTAGLHRGNDQFDDTDGQNSVNFLGGINWTSPSERASLAFALSTTEQGPQVHQQIYSLVGILNVTDNLKYVVQSDLGQTSDRALDYKADWYGLNQYLLYEINTCWAAGMRVEWFRDEDGTRVTGLGDGNLNQGPFIGDFYEITAGLNWRPNANVTVRPEVRWDWYKPRVAGGNLPYDAGDRDNQFLFGCDVLMTY